VKQEWVKSRRCYWSTTTTHKTSSNGFCTVIQEPSQFVTSLFLVGPGRRLSYISSRRQIHRRMDPFYLESLVSNRLVTLKIRCFRLRIRVNYPSVPKAVNMGRTVMLLQPAIPQLENHDFLLYAYLASKVVRLPVPIEKNDQYLKILKSFSVLLWLQQP